jgi:hypothetical protein
MGYTLCNIDIMKRAFDPNYKPWAGNLVWVILIPVYVYLSWQFFGQAHWDVAFWSTVFASFFWLLNLVRLNVRLLGQSVERKAAKQLKSLLGDTCRLNVELPGGGDADALVVLKDGTRINIEIKSVTKLERVRSGHVKQVRKAAVQLKSLPIIWLPRGEENKGKHVDEVAIFSGNARGLRNYIGA